MKRMMISLATLAMAAVLPVTSAFAQGNPLEASIPFNFRVGNTWLPAGDYRITPQSTHAILVRNLEQPKYAVFALATPTGDESSTTASLAFHRYGDQYFLNRIACQCSMNVAFSMSKVEKRARDSQASLRHTDEVLLALK